MPPLLPLLLLLLLLPGSPSAASPDAPAATALNLSDDVARLLPGYHIAQPVGWINDPTGLIYYRGLYHAEASLSPTPFRQGWAHAVSRDLAHWQRLPFALRPGPEPFDADGAWTGTATPGAGPGGAPALLYSCASGRQPPGFFFQQVCAAVPANASDPLLAAWTKLGPVNSLAPPPGGTRGQFHDPSVFASVGALSPAASGLPPPRWRLLVGAQVDCRGAAALFTSPDFKNWTFASLLDAQGPGASLAERLGQRCDQYGDAAGGGALWETPAVFSVPPRAGGTSRNQSSSAVVFKYGLQIAHAPRFATDLFAVGDLEELPGGGARFRPRGPFAPLDRGEVYAAQAMAGSPPAGEGGAPLLWLYAEEAAPRGRRPWQNALTLPRVVTLGGPGGDALLQAFPAALEALRAGGGGGGGASSTPPAAAVDGVLVDAAGPAAVRLNITCAPASAATGCAAGVLITTTAAGAAGAHTAVLLELPGASPPGGGGGGGGGTATLLINRTRTGGPGDARPLNASWPLPAAAATAAGGASADLVLFVDHSVLEALAGGGAAAVTARVYPEPAADGASWGLALAAARGAAVLSARAWALDSAWVDRV